MAEGQVLVNTTDALRQSIEPSSEIKNSLQEDCGLPDRVSDYGGRLGGYVCAKT